MSGLDNELERLKKEAGLAAASAESSIFSCSYTQQRIWYAQQLDPDSAHWNVAMRWRLSGRLRDVTIERAWQKLVERHESLRTTIEEIDGIPHQRIWASWPLKLAIVDLSRLPQPQRDEAADNIARQDAIKSLSLAGQPPLRVQLLRLDDETALLLTNFHNIIVDGWSVGVLLREFGMIASAIEAGQEPDLPEPSLQHVDYTLWQADMLASDSFASDKSYWAEMLANWSRFEIPTDKPRPPVLTHEGDIRTLLLPPRISNALNAHAKAQGCSMFNIGTAMLAACLSNAAGNTDVFIGTQAACRDEPELETLVGPLINTAALRFDLSGNPTLKELLLHCRKRGTEALGHQHLPFNFVVEAVRPKRDPSRNMIYSITCTVQTAHIDTGRMDDLRFNGLTIAALPSFPAGAPTDLGFFMVGREEGWRISCAGNTDLYEVASIDNLLLGWARALEALIDNGDSLRLSDLAKMPVGQHPVSSISSAASAIADISADAVPAIADRSKIFEIWKEVLGVDAVGPETDFFEAGGTSLAALRMLSRVNKSTGRALALTSLLRTPRLGDFAALAIPQAAPEPAPQVAASAEVRGNAVQPILALNNSRAYILVEKPLGSSYPIIDIPTGDAADSEYARTHSFHEIVARVVERIVTAQPNGPYVIMAYCASGIVALEAARQLERQGRKVKLLAMVNAAAPYYVSSLSSRARRVRYAAQMREAVASFKTLRGLWQKGELSTGDFLQQYGIVRKLGLLRLLQRYKLVETTPPDPEYQALLEFPGRVRRALDLAPRLTGQVNCDIAVYRSTDYLKGPEFPPGIGWTEWARGTVHVCDVSGAHYEILRNPTATEEIGQHLKSLLDRLPSDSIEALHLKPTGRANA